VTKAMLRTPGRRRTTQSSSDGIRLRLQRLPGPQRALTVCALAALSSADATFTTRQVSDLLLDLRLPPAANLSTTLGRLRSQSLLIRPSKDTWALTPAGEDLLSSLATHVPPEGLIASLGHLPGSDFGERRHALIPPLLAPAGTELGLQRILDASTFDGNVMLITRFPRGLGDHYAKLIPRLREAVAAHGLRLQVANDGNAEDTLWANVVTYMWACRYAIVLIDGVDGVHNSNVLIEIGGMLMTGRRCAILRDEKAPAMPSDLVGHIYKITDLSDHDESVALIHGWIRDDLRLEGCEACPPPA
jgi:hypothetical protein